MKKVTKKGHYVYDRPRTFISSGGLGTMGFGFGAEGIKVSKKGEVEAAIRKALASTEVPYLVDFGIHEDESVYPIVPPGKPISELIEQ